MNQDFIDAALEAAHTASPEQEYIAELQQLVDPLLRVIAIHIATEDEEIRNCGCSLYDDCSEGDLIVTLKIGPHQTNPTPWDENWGDPQNPDPYYAR